MQQMVLVEQYTEKQMLQQLTQHSQTTLQEQLEEQSTQMEKLMQIT